ncbi:MAG: SWIM zinc finger family protein [Promethearchaeota archaeon]
MEDNNFNRRGKRKREKKFNYPDDKKQKHIQQIKKSLINFAKSSWGKQWIHSILKIGRPFRMERGIQYAKDERIDKITINKSQIFATVQGTAPTPYRVKIMFDAIPEEDWILILKELGSKTLNLVKLLDGILPEDIIAIFEKFNYSLFPDAARGLNATCSCPDKAIPCKHIAATILYVARVLDYNPFILLEIHGKTKNDLLNDLSLAQKLDTNLISKKSKEIAKEDKIIEYSFNIPKISIEEVLPKHESLESDYKINFQFKKPSKIIETLENLGLPPNLDNPQSFENVIRAIYRIVTDDTYKTSLKID